MTLLMKQITLMQVSLIGFYFLLVLEIFYSFFSLFTPSQFGIDPPVDQNELCSVHSIYLEDTHFRLFQ